MKKLLLWLWQASQNIVGLITYKCYKGNKVCTKEICGEGIHCKVSTKMNGGITLGNYIIINNIDLLEHELGHTKQSKMLGPLYLLVIGLPSALHCVFRKCKNYYHFYTEKWANKLMGIK